MKKKRIIFSLLGLGLVAVTLASCGKEKEDNAEQKSSKDENLDVTSILPDFLNN